MKLKNILYVALAVGVGFAAYKLFLQPKKNRKVIRDRDFEIEVEIPEEGA